MHLQVSHLSKSFAGQSVLEDITFVVNSGEKVALLGKNGSGKSTLFKILTGEEESDSGFISTTPKHLNIGFLPQVISNAENLSSGQKLMKKLTAILDGHPDMLLLDEPTNHLDWDSLAWLQEVISDFSGPVLFVSHDRYFLDEVADKILELDAGRLKVYGGNYSLYKEQKQLDRESNLRQYETQQKRVSQLTARINTIKNRTQQLEKSTTGSAHYARRKAAKAASSAISLEKRILKEFLKSSITQPETNWELKALFKPKSEGSPTVAQIKLPNFNFTIQNGERIALIGPNGSGKTTLIKQIINSDQVILGNNIQIGYLSQEHQELDNNLSTLDFLSSSGADKTESYKLLRRFLLPPEKINQPVNMLSSGEQAKLLLAKIMLSGANFIILDEPTNHLDIPSREALEEALVNYPGTLLVASHDRYFLEHIGITNTIFLPVS